MRRPALFDALWLLSPSLGLADGLSEAPQTPERELAEFQGWTEQRRLEASVRLEEQRRDAERIFDRIQQEIRVRQFEQHLDELEPSRSAR